MKEVEYGEICMKVPGKIINLLCFMFYVVHTELEEWKGITNYVERDLEQLWNIFKDIFIYTHTMCVEYIGNERNEQHGGGSENKIIKWKLN